MIDGYLNTGENVNHLTVIGSENTVKNGESNIILGDKRRMDGKSHNVIIGSLDSAAATNASNAVILGHNANASVDGGVALGLSVRPIAKCCRTSTCLPVAARQWTRSCAAR